MPDGLTGARRIAIEDGGLVLFEAACVEHADTLFDALLVEIGWQQHLLKIFGRAVAAPRLSAWYGEQGCDYHYSGRHLPAQPLPESLARLRRKVEALCAHSFNSVLLNLYRDGRDGMGWHSDDEAELGDMPTIASLSLGQPRRLLLRHRRDHGRRLEIELGHGSLLLMEPPMQRFWQHSVPKTRRQVGPRINLSWRNIANPR